MPSHLLPDLFTIEDRPDEPRTTYEDLWPLRPTAAFAAYWWFAAERQRIYFRRLVGMKPPWTADQVLAHHRFTNAYRAADRVSQFLIRNVIYANHWSPEDLFFRTLLFKILNRIDTWVYLERNMKVLSWQTYDFDRLDSLLTGLMAEGKRIFSAAYIMPSGASSFGHPRKHTNYLKLIEMMMSDGVPSTLQQIDSMQQAFELLRSYPLLGDFLAYQFVTDLNYTPLMSFSENDFVIAGPGAKDGIHKCFSDLAGLSYEDIIVLVQRKQHSEFERHAIEFLDLGGRDLQLIDCQNLFCELSKYTRVAMPDMIGSSGRTRIKQKYRDHQHRVSGWFPPKWGINDALEAIWGYHVQH